MTSENPPNSPTPPTPQSHENTHKQASHPESKPPSISCPEVHTKPAHPHYEIPCNKKRDGWDRAKMGAEFFGIGFLVIYTVYTAGIYSANKKAAEAAKSAADTAYQMMRLTYQPRVVISALGYSTGPATNKLSINFLEDNRIRMSSTIANIGPVTAKNVQYFTFSKIIGDKRNAKRLDYTEAHEPFGHLKTILPKAAGYDASTSFFTEVLSPKEISQLTIPNVWTVFSVLITYDDDFGAHHGTEYCDMFNTQGAQDICPWPIRFD